MLKKTITYKDYDGNDRSEVHWFNLTRTEAMEIALELPDGLFESDDVDNTENKEQMGSKIIEKLGDKGLFDFIKKLILKSHGIKSSDGRRFEKSDEISTEFQQTLAFDEMFTELLSNDTAAADFINEVIPVEDINKYIENRESQNSDITTNY